MDLSRARGKDFPVAMLLRDDRIDFSGYEAVSFKLFQQFLENR